MPDYHTDPAFSRAILDVRHDVNIQAVSVEWFPTLELGPRTRPLPIPWDYVEREAQDRGSYLLLLRLARGRVIEVGQLGRQEFAAGWYIYVGSAMANLDARMARHRRLTKKHHWHIDYLRPLATEFEALPIRASERLECGLARELGEIAPVAVPGFGSSDCECPGHLFYSPIAPLDRPDFHGVLERFRMRYGAGRGMG
jgi:sugar fermentation stimulation protein A